jgi:NTP pyrophosphatase (non-canonical NTP hydrolase)
MSELVDMLAEFHDALGDEPGRGNAALRLTLHEEEHDELLDELARCRFGIGVREPKADEDVDRGKLARELADVVYLAFGTAHAFAIDLDVALEEIHRAAMSKLDPATMVVREDGKILKPKGFEPPDMSAAIRRGDAPSLRRSVLGDVTIESGRHADG